MPGWYIHMDVARKAIDKLATNATAAPIFAADGVGGAQIAAIAHANPTYVALGAIGPDIFFLLPDFKPPVGNMLWKLANTIETLFTWWDDNFLGPFESAMGPIENNLQDELNALSGGLANTISDIFSQAFSFLEDTIIKLILEQYDFFGLLSSGVPAGFDEQSFFWSDMLHYRETYRFGATLWQRATALTDPVLRGQCQAFALGWISHLATDVTGHAFVNQKAGGPYRLHWQRHHLVENHMDALVYNTDHGVQPIYDEMSNAALHLWLAFNPDGTSRVNLFTPEPNPPYPSGDDSASITGRHAVWDVDSDLPDALAGFIADTLRAVFTPALSTPETGMVACCPTIISSLTGRVPYDTSGYANSDDIAGAYWWLYKYVKWTTTDYYSIRRPDPPPVVVIPSFPSPPGSGDSDPGPGASSSNSVWDDILDFLLSLFAWGAYLAEIAAWPAALVAGIVAGTATYPLRELLYETLELPLYNLWLGVHSYLAMTGYVMPMPGEINKGLNTLGVDVSDGWAATVVALGDPDGGLGAPGPVAAGDASGEKEAAYPRDVVLDPPNDVSKIISQIFTAGAPAVNGNIPSEFTRPWQFPLTDNSGAPVNIEQPHNLPGPFLTGQDATALFGSMPGTKAARDSLEAAQNETQTISLVMTLLREGQHLGDPQDYTAYLIAKLTRSNLDLSKLPNFNLDSDRGYAYLTWDWLRSKDSRSIPAGFKTDGNPAHTPDLQHVYPTPVEPGYGWNNAEQVVVAPQTPEAGFNPADAQAAVRIRYINLQGKFQ
jgi:Zinc dependent phospholipase C